MGHHSPRCSLGHSCLARLINLHFVLVSKLDLALLHFLLEVVNLTVSV